MWLNSQRECSLVEWTSFYLCPPFVLRFPLESRFCSEVFSEPKEVGSSLETSVSFLVWPLGLTRLAWSSGFVEMPSELVLFGSVSSVNSLDLVFRCPLFLCCPSVVSSLIVVHSGDC